MDIKNILKSTYYLEFINKVDNLVYDLLYGEEGYCLQNSKAAVEDAQKTVEKFNSEAEKLTGEFEEENCCRIIDEKRAELTSKIEKHYLAQVKIWADEVYQNMLDNSILGATLEKEEKDKFYHRGLCAISWISGVKEYTPQEENKLIENFNREFTNALKSTDDDFLPLNYPPESEPKTYLMLRQEIIKNPKEFTQIKLSDFTSKISAYDMSCFKKMQNELLTYKKTELTDEINLIDTSIELMELKDESEKYKFIKEVYNDFNRYRIKNKQLEEEDKLKLIKRRMKLFPKNGKSSGKYFKELLSYDKKD